MAFNYTDILNTATTLIAASGRNVTYQSLDKGGYDAATDTVSGNGYTNTTIKAVILGINVFKTDESTLQRGDRIALISASSITPNEKDKIIDGSATYQIVSIEEVNPGDTAVIYKLQVRK